MERKRRKSHQAAEHMTGEVGKAARQLAKAQRSNQRELDKIMGNIERDRPKGKK